MKEYKVFSISAVNDDLQFRANVEAKLGWKVVNFCLKKEAGNHFFIVLLERDV